MSSSPTENSSFTKWQAESPGSNIQRGRIRGVPESKASWAYFFSNGFTWKCHNLNINFVRLITFYYFFKFIKFLYPQSISNEKLANFNKTYNHSEQELFLYVLFSCLNICFVNISIMRDKNYVKWLFSAILNWAPQSAERWIRDDQ